MAFTPTNRPVPSDAPEDFYFNTGFADTLVTSDEHTAVDRTGKVRKTWAGIERTAASVEQFKNVFVKKIVAELPLQFPGYSAAFTAVGSPVVGYIYPQGHCFDADGRVYIKYANGNKAVIVWYNANYSFGGWFLIDAGGESVVIIDENGARKLYNKAATDKLYVYDITTMPDTGATVSGIDTGISGVGLQYGYGNGRWVIEQLQVDYGGTASRTKWQVYDKDFNKTGNFYVAKNIVGWQLTTSPLYPYVPKSQGIAVLGDKVLFGIGGSYVPETEGPVAPVVSACGIAVCDLDGSLSRYGVLDAAKLIDHISAKGYNCVRMESEGLSTRPNGDVSHILITLRPSSLGVDSAGIILVNEMDLTGEDMSAMVHSYTPFDMSRLTSGSFPRSSDGAIYNPLTNAQFTSMAEVIEFMVETQISGVCWYTSAVALTPIAGIDLPSGNYVEIKNANNESFVVTVTPISPTLGDATQYGVNFSTLSVFKGASDVSSLNIEAIDGSLNVSAKLTTSNRSASDAPILFMHQQSTAGGNLLALGGGSSLYYAISRLWVYIGSTLSTKTGTLVAEFFTNGLNPGTHQVQSLGLSSKEWGELFCVKGTFSGPVKLGQYTLATLPSAAAFNGYYITVTDASGGPKLCRSNGTVWQIANTTTTVS